VVQEAEIMLGHGVENFNRDIDTKIINSMKRKEMIKLKY
jgi:hypothetical protein